MNSDQTFRIFLALIISMIMPAILPYTMPYWTNVLGIFFFTMLTHWVIDFGKWVYKKAKAQQ